MFAFLLFGFVKTVYAVLAFDIAWSTTTTKGNFGGASGATAICASDAAGWVSTLSLNDSLTFPPPRVLRDSLGNILKYNYNPDFLTQRHMLLDTRGLPSINGVYSTAVSRGMWAGTVENCNDWSTTTALSDFWDAVRSPLKSPLTPYITTSCNSNLRILCHRGPVVIDEQDAAIPEMEMNSILAVTDMKTTSDLGGLDGANTFCSNAAGGGVWYAVLYQDGFISSYLSTVTTRVRLYDSIGHIIHPNISLYKIHTVGLDMNTRTVPFMNKTVSSEAPVILRGEDEEDCIDDVSYYNPYGGYRRRGLEECSCYRWTTSSSSFTTFAADLVYSPIFQGFSYIQSVTWRCDREAHLLCVSAPSNQTIASPTPTFIPTTTPKSMITTTNSPTTTTITNSPTATPTVTTVNPTTTTASPTATPTSTAVYPTTSEIHISSTSDLRPTSTISDGLTSTVVYPTTTFSVYPTTSNVVYPTATPTPVSDFPIAHEASIIAALSVIGFFAAVTIIFIILY